MCAMFVFQGSHHPFRRQGATSRGAEVLRLADKGVAALVAEAEGEGAAARVDAKCQR